MEIQIINKEDDDLEFTGAEEAANVRQNILERGVPAAFAAGVLPAYYKRQESIFRLLSSLPRTDTTSGEAATVSATGVTNKTDHNNTAKTNLGIAPPEDVPRLVKDLAEEMKFQRTLTKSLCTRFTQSDLSGLADEDWLLMAVALAEECVKLPRLDYRWRDIMYWSIKPAWTNETTTKMQGNGGICSTCLNVFAAFKGGLLDSSALVEVGRLGKCLKSSKLPVPLAAVCVVIKTAMSALETLKPEREPLLALGVWQLVKSLEERYDDEFPSPIISKALEDMEKLLKEKFPFCGKIAPGMNEGGFDYNVFVEDESDEEEYATGNIKEMGLDGKLVHDSEHHLLVLKGPGHEYFTMVDNQEKCIFSVHKSRMGLVETKMFRSGKSQKSVVFGSLGGEVIEIPTEDFDWWDQD